jgi:hypothetical protein
MPPWTPLRGATPFDFGGLFMFLWPPSRGAAVMFGLVVGAAMVLALRILLFALRLVVYRVAFTVALVTRLIR